MGSVGSIPTSVVMLSTSASSSSETRPVVSTTVTGTVALTVEEPTVKEAGTSNSAPASW